MTPESNIPDPMNDTQINHITLDAVHPDMIRIYNEALCEAVTVTREEFCLMIEAWMRGRK